MDVTFYMGSKHQTQVGRLVQGSHIEALYDHFLRKEWKIPLIINLYGGKFYLNLGFQSRGSWHSVVTHPILHTMGARSKDLPPHNLGTKRKKQKARMLKVL